MFFPNTIDRKPHITTPDGDRIVDLTTTMFPDTTRSISSYDIKKVPNKYIMRPDMVSLSEYGSVDQCEYIMMFNGCGNPFSFNEDDILLIPNRLEADEMIMAMDPGVTEAKQREQLIKNYYKYVNGTNDVDMSSYDSFEKKVIPSGNTEATPQQSSDVSAPFLLGEDEKVMTIRNGRIFFNENPDDRISEEDITNGRIDDRLTEVLSGIPTEISCDNCTFNGTTLSDFIKAQNNAENGMNNN